MKDLSLGARAYVSTVIASGFALLAWSLYSSGIDQPAQFLVFLLLSCLASVLKITVPLPHGVPQHGLTMSLSFAMNFAALLVLGVNEASLIAAAGAWAQCTFHVRQRNPLHRTLFSIAAMAITMQATGAIYALRGTSGVTPVWADELIAIAAATCTHFFVNSALVAVAIALSARQRLSRVWTESFMPGWINQLLGATLGGIAVRGVQNTRYWLLPIAALLLYLGYRTYRAYHTRIEEEQLAVRQLSDLHEATLEALALAIGAKGGGSRTHMRRLQTCSMALARAEGLGDEEVQAIKTAALLHDIGMLAVPQHILSKSGHLSDEELRKLRIHPQVGVDIIRDVPFPSPVAPIILAHHERWDGGGYPAGLKGEAIPLGGRILAIADKFDAVVSEGRYQRVDEIASALDAEAGHCLDPQLVRSFIRLLPQMAVELLDMRPGVASEFARAGVSLGAAVPALAGARVGATDAFGVNGGHLAAAAAGSGRNATGVLGTPGSNPFEHIAQAHREAEALYRLAQALSACLSVSETMSQIATRLGSLIPCSTCALFLHGETRGQLVCRFASGPGASILEPMSLPIGAGPIGWVVEHEHWLVNVSLAVAGEVGSDDGDESALYSALIGPLLGDGGCLGALVVAHNELGCYHDDHRRILERVAEHATVAIQNALRFERTNEAALTDRLTGLTNSRGLASAFEGAVSEAMAYGEPLTVLMIDVDDLKQINDTYGHAAGDRALREVARVLSQAIRTRDICARYAGDEFVAVLRACSGPEGERRSSVLRASFDAVRFPVEPGRLQPLHVSVGTAAYPNDGASLEALLVVADSRMYSDKNRRKRPRASGKTAGGGAARS